MHLPPLLWDGHLIVTYCFVFIYCCPVKIFDRVRTFPDQPGLAALRFSTEKLTWLKLEILADSRYVSSQ
jgi:hypothetical protein